MYVSPVVVDWLIASDVTHAWVTNLSRGSYNPLLGWVGGGVALAITLVGQIIWNQRFEGKI